MATPQALHHALLRPSILHILRAAGYHSTRPSVLDTATAAHADLNHADLDITIQDEDRSGRWGRGLSNCSEKKTQSTDEDSRYHGTMLGRPSEPRIVKVEGGEITSVKEWADRLKPAPKVIEETPSTREASSALSSVGDQVMENMEF
ncbi:hypothetical protein DID88_006359 [Monilinia fructigena]|uniref:Uncharacterized protein n=1 Tax=Monilinia fructigena TaxID=38457 RepID=A0A395J2E0_9HELO|nr:hypothetical protein DID88_006359 [Monilinia fructigena]